MTDFFYCIKNLHEVDLYLLGWKEELTKNTSKTVMRRMSLRRLLWEKKEQVNKLAGMDAGGK